MEASEKRLACIIPQYRHKSPVLPLFHQVVPSCTGDKGNEGDEGDVVDEWDEGGEWDEGDKGAEGG